MILPFYTSTTIEIWRVKIYVPFCLFTVLFWHLILLMKHCKKWSNILSENPTRLIYRRVQMLLRLTLSRYWKTNWCYLRSKSQFDTMHRWIVCKLRECIDLKIWNHHLLSRVVVDPFTLIWIQLVEMYLRLERSMCSAELISTNISS